MSQLGILEKLAVSLEGWLGPRISEGFGLKWQDLDLESGKATFRQGFTKGRISRLKTEASRDDAPIPEDVLRLLRKWKSMTPYNAAGDWVFASPYTKGQRPFWPGPFMTGRLQPVARALGLPHIGWHTFRHSLSAWAKGARLKPEEIKTLLRHQTLKMASEVYGRLELEQKRKLRNARITAIVSASASVGSSIVETPSAPKRSISWAL